MLKVNINIGKCNKYIGKIQSGPKNMIGNRKIGQAALRSPNIFLRNLRRRSAQRIFDKKNGGATPAGPIFFCEFKSKVFRLKIHFYDLKSKVFLLKIHFYDLKSKVFLLKIHFYDFKSTMF